MKLKSSKTTCNFNHAVLLVIACQIMSQSIKTHNTPTYYSSAHNRTGMNLNFFLGEVVLWYSIYVLLAQIRTTWVATTYLFTYALTAKLQHKGPILWSKRGKFSTSKINTYVEIRKQTDSKFWWKSVELSELKVNFTYLDKNQWTLKSSHKDIRTTAFVLRCRRNAKQSEAHSTYKRMLETNLLKIQIKNQLYV